MAVLMYQCCHSSCEQPWHVTDAAPGHTEPKPAKRLDTRVYTCDARNRRVGGGVTCCPALGQYTN